MLKNFIFYNFFYFFHVFFNIDAIAIYDYRYFV